MGKYQYELERDLPSEASAEELARVECLCSQRKSIELGDSAKEFLSDHSIPEHELRGAIIRHIRARRKVFHKFQNKKTRELIPDDVQANVTIREGFDIYVEVWLADETMVVIYAHDHTPGKRRLPQ